MFLLNILTVNSFLSSLIVSLNSLLFNDLNFNSFSKNLDEIKIEVISNDQMEFIPNILLVNTGQKITLTLKHLGKLDKSIMGHNFVLLKKGTSIEEFGQAALTHSENDYIPINSNATIAYTDLIGGGESSTITFDAPDKGIYDYICSFPGHWSIMKGKLIVK
tara:strand:- start:11657 stop:12142 length:486 start_codon:yes stop_codon:yes gene_type:complete